MANIARLDALLPLDPRVQRAGYWGGTVYFHLLLLNRAHQCQGLIPPQYAAPGYLASYIGLDRAAYLTARAVDVVKDGMRAAVREGLIAIEPDGVRLVDRHHWECESAARVRAFRAREKADGGDRDKPSQPPDRTPQRGETRRDLPPDRASMAHVLDSTKTGPTPPVASTPPLASGSGVGSPQIAGRRVLRDPGVAVPPAVLHTEAGEHNTSEGPTDSDGNVTGVGPTPPFPPPFPSPLLVSPLNPLPYPPSPNPLQTPGDAPPVDCNDVTLHELGLDGGDLELPFEPTWMGQPVTASSSVDETDPPTHRGKRAKEPKHEVPDTAFTLAETLRAEIVKFNPQARIAGLNSDREDKLRAEWAVVIDRLNRVDGVAWGEILATITWCFRTERYWAGVIVSARQLRDKWDQIQAQRVRARETSKPATAPTTAPRAPAPPPPPPEDRGGPITIAEIRDAQRAIGILQDHPEDA